MMLCVSCSQKGKWYADTSKYRELAELNKMFPGLDLGKHLAQQLIGGADITADATPITTPEPQGGDIDPFK